MAQFALGAHGGNRDSGEFIMRVNAALATRASTAGECAVVLTNENVSEPRVGRAGTRTSNETIVGGECHLFVDLTTVGGGRSLTDPEIVVLRSIPSGFIVVRSKEDEPTDLQKACEQHMCSSS